MTDIIIDIETLSTKTNALILTIGAIKFNRKDCIKDIKEMETFYLRVDIDSCKKLKMDIDNDTIKWWENQDTNISYEALYNDKDRINIKDALNKLSLFIKNSKYIWANSPNFDCTILENAFNVCELDIPWKFWNLRDCRTVYDLAKFSLNSLSSSKDHNALNDCHKQYIALKKCFEILKL